ncbi:hypothetical protein [Amycolatopsis australiensis]|nr:hypothetical protein [Amycolatopsis australiensis]
MEVKAAATQSRGEIDPHTRRLHSAEHTGPARPAPEAIAETQGEEALD